MPQKLKKYLLEAFYQIHPTFHPLDKVSNTQNHSDKLLIYRCGFAHQNLNTFLSYNIKYNTPLSKSLSFYYDIEKLNF